MTTNLSRNYNCKDEELPVICKFVLFSLRRDLTEFTDYSPKFNAAYVTGFETKISTVAELVVPKSETKILKTITEQIYSSMDDLKPAINHLSGYIDMAMEELKLSPADFGLTDLRNGINKRDAESVIKNLHLVNTEIAKYIDILTPKGLNEKLIAKFSAAHTSISADKQRKYEITSNRKSVVQNNLGILNDLNDQLSEILKIGKILYKTVDAAKLKEYSFTELMKQVRKVSKNGGDTTEDKTEGGTNPEPAK
jgi:hypothetical protein